MTSEFPAQVTPFAEPNIIKNPNIISLNYTNQDFWSMKSRLVTFIEERFGENGTVIPNTFNDFSESSIAILLMENFAFLADTLSFKIDQYVNELFIDTVTEIENAFRLSKLVGFTPQPPIAARSMWTASLNAAVVTDVAIPTPLVVDVVSQNTPIIIELFQADSNNRPIFDEDIIIPAGQVTNLSVVGLEGRTINEAFTGTGAIAQTFSLGFTPVIWDSVRVEIDDIRWTQVEYFTDSQPRREFRVEFDSNYNGYIIFGNNRAGMIPSIGSIINVTYRVGGGTIGNIVTGAVETQRQVSVPGLKFTLPVTFRNYTKGEYGYDGDNIDDIRNKLPAWIRTQDRAVSGSDYKTLTDQFATPYNGKIGKSTVALRNYGCSGNIVDVYILAQSGENDLALTSNELKVALNDMLNQKKMLTDFVCLKDGTIIVVDVLVEITLDKFYRKFEEEIKQKINNKLNSFFSLNNWEYGKTLKENDLIKQLVEIKEAQSFDITFITEDEDNSGNLVTARFNEIIRPEQINLNFIYV